MFPYVPLRGRHKGSGWATSLYAYRVEGFSRRVEGFIDCPVVLYLYVCKVKGLRQRQRERERVLSLYVYVLNVYVHAHIHIEIHVHICVLVYMYIYIHIARMYVQANMYAG